MGLGFRASALNPQRLTHTVLELYGAKAGKPLQWACALRTKVVMSYILAIVMTGLRCRDRVDGAHPPCNTPIWRGHYMITWEDGLEK